MRACMPERSSTASQGWARCVRPIGPRSVEPHIAQSCGHRVRRWRCADWHGCCRLRGRSRPAPHAEGRRRCAHRGRKVLGLGRLVLQRHARILLKVVEQRHHERVPLVQHVVVEQLLRRHGLLRASAARAVTGLPRFRGSSDRSQAPRMLHVQGGACGQAKDLPQRASAHLRRGELDEREALADLCRAVYRHEQAVWERAAAVSPRPRLIEAGAQRATRRAGPLAWPDAARLAEDFVHHAGQLLKLLRWHLRQVVHHCARRGRIPSQARLPLARHSNRACQARVLRRHWRKATQAQRNATARGRRGPCARRLPPPRGTAAGARL